MRIVLVNWAKIWDGATDGGGVNGYCQALALELVERGHDVVYLSSGTTFVPDVIEAAITPGACRVRRHPDWLGVRVFEVVNSPVIAPAGFQFREPGAEIADEPLDREIEAWARRVKPDVIHLHNIEGLTAGSVAAMMRGCERRPALIYSLHNYHTVCPQAYLMHRYAEPCHDDLNGARCEGCIPGVDGTQERNKRATSAASAQGFVPLTVTAEALQSVALPVPVQAASGLSMTKEPPPDNLLLRAGFADRLAWLLTGRAPGLKDRDDAGVRAGEHIPIAETVSPPAIGSAHQTSPANSLGTGAAVSPAARQPTSHPALPGRGHDADWEKAWEADGADTRGQTAWLLGDRTPPRVWDETLPEFRPITNEIRPRQTEVGEGNEYARRRRAMVSMLNSCDRVLAVSRFVRDRYESMGVDASLLEVMPIGTRVSRVVERRADLVFDPPAFDPANPRAIRLVFMGYNNVYKGLSVLADAMDSLPASVLSRYHFSMFAQAGETIEWRFRRMEPRLAGLTVHFGYQYYDVPWMLGGKDLGVVPSIWWDNAPQTVFEFFSCGVPVLGANVGGIPDFVRPNENGLLFRGNDRADLARRLTQIAADPSILTRLRAGVRPPKDIGVHAIELEGLYRGCLGVKNDP